MSYVSAGIIDYRAILGGFELPESGTITYYPYQIRAMMPMTGLEITPCNQNDKPIIVVFEDGTAVSYGFSTGYERDLEYETTTENDVIVYKDADDPTESNFIGFTKNGLCAMQKIVDCWMYTDYTFEDQRGSASQYRQPNTTLPNYGGAGNSGGTSKGRTCAGCRGTGQCTMCNGRGWVELNTGYYTGQSYTTREKCSVCYGDGRCRVCYGQGTIQ